jgi:integrase
MSSLIHHKNLPPNKKRLNFNFSLPDGSRLTDPQHELLYISTKEFCYRRLRGCGPIRPRKATTIYAELLRLRILIYWMITNKCYAFSQLCPHHVEVQFLSSLKGISEGRPTGNEARTDKQLAAILQVTQRLWDLRGVMSDSLTFNPFKGKCPMAVLGVERVRCRENRTPVIPDEVMIPLANEAINYVYIYADDILTARARIEVVRERLQQSNLCESAFGVRGNVIFNVSHTSCHANAALTKVSIATSPYTGEPWREPFLTVNDLYQEEAHLLAACYVVIAWLTGMRDGEIKSLRENCLRRELSEDGVVERLKVSARLFKGVSDARGREETWVVIEPVAKAIEVLTKLTQGLRARAEDGVDELFLGGDRRRTVTILTSDSVSKKLQKFATHINLPSVAEKAWKLCPRQFRRTLARWIARKPFGEVAGMIQFKHVELTTFEGYVGRDEEFRKELAEEKILANIDLLESLRQDALTGNVTGPKAPDLIATFRGVAGDRRADDEAFMLKHLARTLYVGAFNLCFYDPAHAMCQQHLPVQERKSPITSHCVPDRCLNSCITKQHLGAYKGQLDETERLLKTPKLPAPQRLALVQEIERIGRIVAPLLDASES